MRTTILTITWRNMWAGIFAFALLAIALLLLFGHPAYAQPALGSGPTRVASIRNFGIVNSFTSTANSTTAFVAVTGASVANSTVYDPAEPVSFGFPNRPENLYVRWSVDVTKATAGGGTCEVFLNGTGIAASARVFTPAAWPTEGTIAGVYRANLANSDPLNTGLQGELQTFTVRCKSSDTNAFTANTGSLEVEEHY